ncbi:MAG: hypothetical protein QW514_06190 [Thermoprotei archaeon]
MMDTKEVLVEEEETLLPLCESNRNIVVDPTVFADHVVFRVGSLKLIDRAP